jgi:UDP-N-acetylmuramyl tripeptide synthase
MGVVAVNFSDFSYVTSDNPRTESPSAILDDIEAGIRAIGKTNYVRIEDRAAAIKKAISDCHTTRCIDVLAHFRGLQPHAMIALEIRTKFHLKSSKHGDLTDRISSF